MDVDHDVLYKFFEKNVNNFLRGNAERQPSKKHACIFGSSIFDLFVVKTLLNKAMLNNNNFWKMLVY
jgi:hypothetical protein